MVLGVSPKPPALTITLPLCRVYWNSLHSCSLLRSPKGVANMLTSSSTFILNVRGAPAGAHRLRTGHPLPCDAPHFLRFLEIVKPMNESRKEPRVLLMFQLPTK